MKKKYDVIIVGAGPAGVFCAMELIKNKRDIKILIVDEGAKIEERRCNTEFVGRCTGCKVCKITHGFAGAGAFSDCKLSLYNPKDMTFVGGELESYMSAVELKTLLDEVVSIYKMYGIPEEKIGGIEHPIAKGILERAQKNGLEMTIVPFMHAGTTNGRRAYYLLQTKLQEDDRVDMLFNTHVEDVIVENGDVKGILYTKFRKEHKIYAKKVLLATGRAGASWNKKICAKHGIQTKEGKIKIGVRYELPDEIMGAANELYEPKFKAPETKETDAAITFCHNPYCGSVVAESYDGEITLVNGHADNVPTGRTNMALLFKMNFGENAIDVVKNMARMLNVLSNGQVAVQRTGDFFSNIPTTREKLKNNPVTPTLESAVPVNLQEIMPARLVNNIQSFINKIDKVIPGFAAPDNLIYGLEIKFSNLSIKVDENFMTKIEGLYVAGDGAGISNGLIQSSASGLYVGRMMLKGRYDKK